MSFTTFSMLFAIFLKENNLLKDNYHIDIFVAGGSYSFSLLKKHEKKLNFS